MTTQRIHAKSAAPLLRRGAGTERSGFTLLEILIVLGMASIIAGIGMVIGIDAYQRYTFRSERDVIVNLLHQARAEAVQNIGATPTTSVKHGVYVTASPAEATFFRGDSYASVTSVHVFTVPLSPAITHNPPSFEVVFNTLSGDTVTSTLALSDGVRSGTITVNPEGSISW